MKSSLYLIMHQIF